MFRKRVRSVVIPKTSILAVGVKPLQDGTGYEPDNASDVRVSGKAGAARRVRSIITPKHDPMQDKVQSLVDTLEGKNNMEKHCPPLNQDQLSKAGYASVSQEPCFLCGDETPYSSEVFKVPEGLNQCGQVAVFYTFCLSCKMDVTSKAKAEYRLVRQLQEENQAVQ